MWTCHLRGGSWGQAIVGARLRPRVLCSVLCLALFAGLPIKQSAADGQDGATGIATNKALETLIRKNETKWKETYKDELNKPVLDALPEARQFLPDLLQGITLGMKEQDLQKERQNTKDNGFGGPMLRDMYEFVPGSLTEDMSDTKWARAGYNIHRRRLVGVTLHSIIFADVKRANELAEALVAKYLPLAGRPSEMKVANDVWGQPDRAALVWKKGKTFVAVMQGRTEKKEYPVTLVVGASAYHDDIMKYYSFSDMPPEQIEQVVRERFPFLQKMAGAGQ